MRSAELVLFGGNRAELSRWCLLAVLVRRSATGLPAEQLILDTFMMHTDDRSWLIGGHKLLVQIVIFLQILFRPRSFLEAKADQLTGDLGSPFWRQSITQVQLGWGKL